MLLGVQNPGFARKRPSVHTVLMLADVEISPEQVKAYRRMPPERRLALAEGLYWSARELKAAWLRQSHPEWSEAEVAREVTRIFTNARS